MTDEPRPKGLGTGGRLEHTVIGHARQDSFEIVTIEGIKQVLQQLDFRHGFTPLGVRRTPMVRGN
jgi:hypothetical protein